MFIIYKMMNFQDLLKKQNQNQLVLMVVLLLYVLFDTPVPYFLKPYLNNLFGQLVIVLISIVLLLYYNPILGVLGIYVAFLMLQKSSSPVVHESKPVVTEQEKKSQMQEMNQLVRESDESLEHETVNKMTPFVSNLNFTNPSYKPVLEDGIKGSSI